jgi:hypothetical protein
MKTIKCKKDYYHLDVLQFKKDNSYEVLSETEFVIRLKGNIDIQFRKIEEMRVGIDNFSKLEKVYDYFYPIDEK